MRCIETTQCLNLDDCGKPEKCGDELQALDGATAGIAESLLSCRLDAGCACFSGPAMIQCGGLTCSAYQPEPPNPIAQPCCGGMNGDLCGLDPAPLFGPGLPITCVESNQPGQLDSNCPTHAPAGPPWNGVTLPGCCRPDGKCGVQDGVTMLGCIEQNLFGVAGEPPSCP
jgi:hypothetical protein